MTEHYDDLVRQFNPKTLSQESQQPLLQLRSYLTALTHVVSKLDKAHIALVDAIVGMPWTTMDSAFVKIYISFIGMLVSARPEYLTLVLERTSQAFTFCELFQVILLPSFAQELGCRLGSEGTRCRVSGKLLNAAHS